MEGRRDAPSFFALRAGVPAGQPILLYNEGKIAMQPVDA